MKLPAFLSMLLLSAMAMNGGVLPANLMKENLAAWCIVPFDASKRGPEARAKMLQELGIRRSAYDWRAQHVKEFEEEIRQYRKHGIEFFAFWSSHETAFKLFEKYNIRPQVWRTLASPKQGTQAERIQAAADAMEGLAKRTGALGCKFGLYNHGGWGGEPGNLVAVCQELRKRGHAHVGIVYNWHHGHGHIDDWKASLELMKPYLLCLNLNGMNTGAQPKILTLGQGQHDQAMLKVLIESGYDGPVGVLDHQNDLDAREALQDSLDGLEWLKKEYVRPGSGGPKPRPKARAKTASVTQPKSSPKQVASLSSAFGQALTGGLVVAGKAEWREPPITVECRVRLRDAKGYNILVASDTKASNAHWEIFSMSGSGKLRAYIPGANPDHVDSNRVITDNGWHSVAMQYAADRVRLWVDGEKVADQEISLKPDRRIVPGGLAMARLVEGRLGLRGAIDEVRVRKGIHEDVAKVVNRPFGKGAEDELGYWTFEKLTRVESVRGQLPFPRKPLDQTNPWWREHINRYRLYDFYAKQAIHYGRMSPDDVPRILPEFPGMDAGDFGHWGYQNDQNTWKDGRSMETDFGSMISGVFRGAGKTIARAVCVELGKGANVVFNQQSLRFEVGWQGEPARFTEVRHGFAHGLKIGKGKPLSIASLPPPGEGARYAGLFREGDQIIFAIEENGAVTHRCAVFFDGRVVEKAVAAPNHFAGRWPQRLITGGELGKGKPYAIDTLELPYKNPWQALFFVGGVDFLTAERIAICTIHGDVWLCDVSDSSLKRLTWKRFAAGLHQPLGLKVMDGVIHAMCRDQIIALHDRNGDDEADFYECVANAHGTSAGGHDYITGLQRDDAGRWYFASGNQGICRTTADGRKVTVLGTGLRNPNGLAISPDGSVVLSNVQEGNWTPASAILDISRGGHYGMGGPKAGDRGYVPPMLYLPRGIDNSSGGQTYISSDRWGPVRGQWIHYSMGTDTHYLVLREVIDGGSQAAAVVLPGEFASGAHRGRFSPFDGQLYVAGSQGWATYGSKDGSLQRVRYMGGGYPYPIAFETRDNGILLTFYEPCSAKLLDGKLWFAQQWNYRYGPGYGSKEYSVVEPAKTGHDRVAIRAVHRIGDGRRLFVEIPQLRPVNQLHLHFNGGTRIEIYATLHRLGKPFTDYPGYLAIAKTWGADSHIARMDANDPTILMTACAACHHAEQRIVGPSLNEIKTRYAGNPGGIVKWAMNPQNKNPQLPPMPSFSFLGEEKLRVIADHILRN